MPYIPLHGIISGRCTCGKNCGSSAGKHPLYPAWQTHLVPTLDDIGPECNVGLPTGAPSGMVVLDFDGDEGLCTLKSLAAAHPEFATAWVQRTGGGGVHVGFAAPSGQQVRNRVRVAPGMDVRGDGGLIVLAPSVHYSGKRYEIIQDPEVLPAIPPRLMDIIQGRATSEGDVLMWVKRRRGPWRTQWRAVVEGKPWAEPGEREATLFALCREIAHAFPSADPSALADIFTPSLTAMDAKGEAWASVNAVVDKISRCQVANRTEKPTIILSHDDYEILEQANKVLGEHALSRGIYAQASRLVLVCDTDALPEQPIRGRLPSVIRSMPPTTLAAHLSSVARWVRRVDGGDKIVRPPNYVAHGLLEMGQYPGVPPIEGFAYGPMVRPDGSMWDGRGYDPQTGLVGRDGWDPPTDYSDTALSNAKAIIWRYVDEFSWRSPADYSAWVAGILTGICRYAFTGPSPLFLLDGNVAGAGKTRLASMLSYIITGAAPSMFSGGGRVEEEDRKKITALARAGARVVLLDNASGKVGTSALEEAITLPASVWTDRLLGGNEYWAGSLLPVWIMTSNNVELSKDLLRRTCYCRLLAPERPEDRIFRDPAPEMTVLYDRRIIYDAALTIIGAWVQAGRRFVEKPKAFGSFEQWSDWVRGALLHADFPDPVETKTELETQGEDATARDLVLGVAEILAELGGTATAGQIIELAYSGSTVISGKFSVFRNAIDEMRHGKDVISVAELGKILRKYKDRIFDGVSLTPARSSTARKWALAKIDT